MSFPASIESPHTVATLSRPLNSAKGGYQVANVWSGAAGTKRKHRAAVAVAIDDEGLNIYDVENPKIISSHAVAPGAAFTCPPCALRLQRPEGGGKQQVTYTAIHFNDTHTILRFSDTHGQSDTPAPRLKPMKDANAFHDLADAASPVCHLDVVPDQSDRPGALELLAIHEDGQVRCFSEDLAEERWRTTHRPESGTAAAQAKVKVELASLVSLDAAQKGLLKGRDDALASLAASLAVPDHACPLLVLVTRLIAGPGARSLPRRLDILRIPAQGMVGQHLQTLVSVTLPDSAAWSHRSPPMSLDAGTGTLHCMSDGILHVYDLSGTIPTLDTQLPLVKGTSSFVRISKNSVLTASAAEMDLLDVQHRSCQAVLPLRNTLPPNAGSKKRKLAQVIDEVETTDVTLVSFMSRLGVVVGLSDRRLVAIRVERPGNGSRAATRVGDGSLLHAIGRGLPPARLAPRPALSHDLPHPFARYLVPSNPAAERYWKEQVARMDRYVARGDLENLERVFAKAVGIRRDESQLDEWRKRRDTWKAVVAGLDAPETNGTSHRQGAQDGSGTPATASDAMSGFTEERPLPDWQFPTLRSDEARPVVDSRKVTYALRIIFTITPPSEPPNDPSASTLSIKTLPPNIFRWLFESGSFSVESLEYALSDEVPRFRRRTQILPGQFIRALVKADPDMKLLLTVLMAPAPLSAPDVVEAVTVLMRSLEYVEQIDGKSPDGLSNGIPPEALTNGDLSMTLLAEEAAAEEDLNRAMSTLEDGGGIRERALTLALTRLFAFPTRTIIHALRTMMSRTETLSLIHLLRVEMAREGWISRYVDEEIGQVAAEDDEQHGLGSSGGGGGGSDRSITLISDLLRCAVDSISTGGWIGAVDAAAGDASDLVSALQGEVSAALEGIEEATYLTGLLYETLRFGKSYAAANKPSGSNSASTLAAPLLTTPTDTGYHPPSAPAPGTIITQTRHSALSPDGSSLLPLSLKAEEDVARVRVGAGGEVQRLSARAVGRLRSMRVPKYSRERILV